MTMANDKCGAHIPTSDKIEEAGQQEISAVSLHTGHVFINTT
jgi:hypothetical protein